MPWYRRRSSPGGTYFFTLVTHLRRPLFREALARRCLRQAINSVREDFPFVITELVLLLDHLHIILTLPGHDADFSRRIGEIKLRFTKLYLASGGTELRQSSSRSKKGYRGVWQKHYWEHLITTEDDLIDCRKYCWFNPVKHGLTRCAHEWPYSTFHAAVKSELATAEWCCQCDGTALAEVRAIAGAEMD